MRPPREIRHAIGIYVAHGDNRLAEAGSGWVRVRIEQSGGVCCREETGKNRQRQPPLTEASRLISAASEFKFREAILGKQTHDEEVLSKVRLGKTIFLS